MTVSKPLLFCLALAGLAAAAAPAAGQWVGGDNRSTVRRAEPRQTAPYAPGFDLTGYCQRRGYYALRPENGIWVCVNENGRLDVDLSDVCRDMLGPTARARLVRGRVDTWVCTVETERPGDMGEGASPAPGNDAGVAPTGPAAQAETPPSAPGSPADAAPDGAPSPVGPPIFGVPPSATPPAAPGAAPEAAPADSSAMLPTGPLHLWTGLPFYARAVIAGLAALVLGLMLGALVRRKPARED